MPGLPKINIGAGKRTMPGWINADLHHGPGVDVVFDACKTWPFDDNSIGMIFGNHMLEHLPDPLSFFREAHRVLVHSGFLELTMPYGISNEALADPTHLKQWIPTSFCFLQPGYDEECQNPQHDAWTAYFSVEVCLRQVNEYLRWLIKPIVRHIGLRILPFLWDAYNGLIVNMIALKDENSVKAWRSIRFPQRIVVRDYMYRHKYEGRELNQGERKKLVFFAERSEF